MFGRRLSFEMQVLPARGADPAAIMMAGDAGLYSDFFGGGRRRFLNPYVGTNVGWAHFGDLDAFTIGGGVGVELYRGPWLLVDLGVRAQLLLYEDNRAPADLALRIGLGMGVPF
jgi:hypothetical protein